MTKWYQNQFRRTLLDMHIEDWDDRFMEQFDPEEYFSLLKKAQITAPMIYIQSHVGLCYWPTKTGVMHKAFVGNEDKIKHLIDLCHEDGMDVIIYYSIIFNNREFERHPEWRMLDANGHDSRFHGGRYGLCCPNNEEYREFVKAQIKEFCEYFEFEGVFFDMTFWPEVCYCDSCKKKWAQSYEGPMPEVVDWTDERWLEFDRKRHEWIYEFGKMCTDELHKYRPDASVEHQYGNSIAFWRFGNNENVSQVSDYIGTDLYGGIRQQSLACKAWYNLTQNQPFQYMTSRCYPKLDEHTSTKSKDQLRQCVAMTYLHHGASLLIDAIDPAGTLDERVYDLIGEVYGEAQAYEPYLTTGIQAYDVSLYFNLNGKYDYHGNGIHVMDHRLDRDTGSAGTMPHYDALKGASDILASEHIPYGIINNWKRDEMFRHKVLIVPDAPGMSKEEADMILQYVRDGGNLYISGCCREELMTELFGTREAGYTDGRMTYLAPTENSDIMEGYFTYQYPLVMFEPAVRVESGWKGTALATLTFPYTKPGARWSMFPTDIHEEEYVDKDDPAYPFATIHANPPGIWTEEPGILYTEYGQGKVVWSAIPIERAERYQHSAIFANIIRMLAEDEFCFSASASESVECVMFDAPEEKKKLIGVIETRDLYRIPDTYDTTLYVKADQAPKKVCLLPGEKEIPYSYENGKVRVSLEKFSIFAMLMLEWE